MNLDPERKKQIEEALERISQLPTDEREEALLTYIGVAIGVMDEATLRKFQDLLRRGCGNEAVLEIIEGNLALRELRRDELE